MSEPWAVTSTPLSCHWWFMSFVPGRRRENDQMFVPADLLIKNLFVFREFLLLVHLFCHWWKSWSCCGNLQESFLSGDKVTKLPLCIWLVFSGGDFVPPGYPDAPLEGEMPASFSSCGSTFKYSQTLRARRLNLSADGRFRARIHNTGACTVGRHRNMTIIGSPGSCLTSTSSRTGPSHSDALIHTQTLIAMHSCPDQFELHSGDHL